MVKPQSGPHFLGQGAPRTTRWIKTRRDSPSSGLVTHPVRERPAPSGALRLEDCRVVVFGDVGQSGSTQHHQVH
ncbi:glutamate dehydrogenase [Actinomyces sp. oral taxon 178 str. F0338]|nr:glutamate dehydrogenase [Actinomyces sp. oral taxon 178 str. F0338]